MGEELSGSVSAAALYQRGQAEAAGRGVEVRTPVGGGSEAAKG